MGGGGMDTHCLSVCLVYHNLYGIDLSDATRTRSLFLRPPHNPSLPHSLPPSYFSRTQSASHSASCFLDSLDKQPHGGREGEGEREAMVGWGKRTMAAGAGVMCCAACPDECTS